MVDQSLDRPVESCSLAKVRSKADPYIVACSQLSLVRGHLCDCNLRPTDNDWQQQLPPGDSDSMTSTCTKSGTVSAINRSLSTNDTC